ncbi:MAG: hypothetical protein E7028_11390 [Planctomycetaceae bacterium]|nr:hypothetical protein [Planctomycetaceae bacterium]MBQ2820650.1 flagellar biosynthesis anti-sigma factor FlgM [Thermoguttaceae bacterium]
MEINKLSNVSGISRVNAVQQPKAETGNTEISQKENVQLKQDVVNIQGTETASVSDVTFSGEKIDGIRTDLVNRVRAEIAAGTYETPEKLEIALEKLLASFDD